MNRLLLYGALGFLVYRYFFPVSSPTTKQENVENAINEYLKNPTEQNKAKLNELNADVQL